MIIEKLNGEKLETVKGGIGFCCWGAPGDGCDCTEGGRFASRSDVWIGRLTKKSADKE